MFIDPSLNRSKRSLLNFVRASRILATNLNWIHFGLDLTEFSSAPLGLRTQSRAYAVQLDGTDWMLLFQSQLSQMCHAGQGLWCHAGGHLLLGRMGCAQHCRACLH